MQYDLGLIGLGVMGQNLVLNLANHGYSVAVYNRTGKVTEEFVNGSARGKAIGGATTIDQFLQMLKRPRRVLVMVKAGAPVDNVIAQLLPGLDKGDLVIDCGNSYFKDTIRRTQQLEAAGLLYLGVGVSGGASGALNGPSIMPGGSKQAWDLVAPYFTAISAHVNQEPCCRFLGPDGAGHFVKMVHNGIEYADMQLISEAYLLLRELGGMSPAELQQIFTEWNQGDLNSYLIEITAAILGKTDADTEKPMVDMIMDRAGQKGTGRWTVQEALELGTAIPAVAEAVFARCLSTLKEERVQAAKELTGPAVKPEGDRKALIQAVQEALYASKICSYAQGFAMLGVASQNYHWQLDLGEIALLWRGGCIIRAQFLNRIKEAYAQNRDLANLMLADYFKERLIKADESWRRVVGLAVANGLSVPVFSAALSYYDSYRRSVLPANLIQAQRDYFGAHTYERVDRTGIYHSEWEVPEKRITSVKADA